MDYEDIYNNHKFMKSLDADQREHFEYEAELEYEVLANFDDFWADVEKYAEKVGLSTRYIEEEFIINGELIEVQLKQHWQDKYDPNEEA